MEVEFYGATAGITGSCHIVRIGGRLILLDCGLIQGRRRDELRNRLPFPFDPGTIDAVVLSHGHIDHSGRIPLLVRQGYTGPIYVHNATRDLCQILLEDSASLQERDAEYASRRRKRRGRDPVTPLYTVEDARHATANMVGLPYGEIREILPGVRLRYRDAGHILGSCSVELWLREGERERKLVFSGDLGQYDSPILNDPEAIAEADHVIVESTYGDRLHRDRARTVEEIGEIVSDDDGRRGNLLIPAFSIGRSQDILYYLGQHYEEWGLERWQVFLDSPMAIRASRVYWDHPQLYDEEATRLRRELLSMPSLANLRLTISPQESMAINRIKSGAIVIAGSGMCNGGRIVHHLKHNLGNRATRIMIVGYQARGTLGRRLVDGESEVRIHGEWFSVNAQVHTVGGLSAHADADDLCRWMGSIDRAARVHVVHGEPEAKQTLKERLGEMGFRADVPGPGEVCTL